MKQSNSLAGRFFALKAITISLLLAFFSSSSLAQQPKSGNWDGLKKMMTAEEFERTGLNNLSADELKLLDRWFLKFLAHESEQLVKADKKIKKLQQEGVRRHIVGHFSGWTGKTVFRLNNGEIWKQRLGNRYAVSLENPEVEIKKNLFGFYEMTILKTGRRVGVTRVK